MLEKPFPSKKKFVVKADKKEDGPKEYKKKERRPPKRPSATYFENVALWYLQKYSATEALLRRALERRVFKAKAHYDDLNFEAIEGWIVDVIDKMRRLGFVDDAIYEDNKIRTLRRQGGSKRKIEQKLMEKGLKVTLPSDEEAELAAAIAYVRRRRLGQWRTRTIENAEEKDLSSLARAGFNRQISLAALEQSAPDFPV